MTTNIDSLIGKRFRHGIADANVLFEVTARIGRSDNYRATAVDEPFEIGGKTYPSDYAGEVRAFTGDQVRAAVRWSETVENLFARSDDYWSSRTVGEVLHYHNGFGQFVRGVVVVLDEQNTQSRNYGNASLGELGLLPTALVGDWQPRDLVYRHPWGDVGRGYHAQKIVDGNGAWQPNTSCVFEAPDCSPMRGKWAGMDPRTLPEHDLSDPPPLAGDDARMAALLRARTAANKILSEMTVPEKGTPRDDTPEAYARAIEAAAHVLLDALDADSGSV